MVLSFPAGVPDEATKNISSKSRVEVEFALPLGYYSVAILLLCSNLVSYLFVTMFNRSGAVWTRERRRTQPIKRVDHARDDFAVTGQPINAKTSTWYAFIWRFKARSVLPFLVRRFTPADWPAAISRRKKQGRPIARAHCVKG